MKFELGQVVVTPRAEALLQRWGRSVDELLARHQSGDWGDVTDEERQINNEGLARQFSLMSSYVVPGGERLTVFTKSDRSATMIHIGPRMRDGVASD